MEAMKSMRWLMLVSGILWVILGITCIFHPVSTLVTLAMFFSIAMLVSGISQVAAYFSDFRENRSGWVLAGGILSVVLGLWLLIGRGYTALAAMIPFVVSIWVLSEGVSRTIGAFTLKDAGMENWGWVLALGIVEILLGGMLTFMPILSGWMAAFAVSAMCISHGLSDISMFRTVSHIRSYFKDMFGKRV